MIRSSAFAIRVGALYDTFRDVVSKSEQAWRDEIAGSPSPERQLMTWEIVAFAYRAFFEARTPTPKCKDQALRVLLDCSADRTEADIHRQAYKALSIAEIRSLIEHFESARQTARALARFTTR